MSPEEIFIKAASEGNLAAVRQAIEIDGIDLDYQENGNGLTALCKAAQGGHVAVVEFLLGKNARHDLKIAGFDNKTVVHFTVNTQGNTTNSTYSILGLLKKAGADLNAKSDGGHSLLRTAFYHADLKFSKYLLANGLRDNPNTLLRIVLHGLRFVNAFSKEERLKSRQILIQWCIMLGADINYPGKIWTEEQRRQVNADKNFDEFYMTVLDFNRNIDYAESPLVRAVKTTRLSLVEFLVVELGANPNQADARGALPLFVAHMDNNYDMMKLLLRNGAILPWAFPLTNISDDIVNFFDSLRISNDYSETSYFARRAPSISISLNSHVLCSLASVKPPLNVSNIVLNNQFYPIYKVVTDVLRHASLNQRDNMKTFNTPLHSVCLSKNLILLKIFLVFLPNLTEMEQVRILTARNASLKTILDIALEQVNISHNEKVAADIPLTTLAGACKEGVIGATTPVDESAVVPPTAAMIAAAQRWFHNIIPETTMFVLLNLMQKKTAKPLEHQMIDEIMYVIQNCINVLVAKVLNTMPLLAETNYDIMLPLVQKLVPQHPLVFGSSEEIQGIVQTAFESAMSKHNLEGVFTKQKEEAAKNNVHSQYNVGLMYERGLGVEKNSLLALGYFRMVAARNEYKFKQVVADKAKRLEAWVNTHNAPMQSELISALTSSELKSYTTGLRLILDYAYEEPKPISKPDDKPNNLKTVFGNSSIGL